MTPAHQAVLLDVDQARDLQVARVLRDDRQRDVLWLGQLCHTLRAIGQLLEDRPPNRVHEGLEDCVQVPPES